jgi:hypothetical protein
VGGGRLCEPLLRFNTLCLFVSKNSQWIVQFEVAAESSEVDLAKNLPFQSGRQAVCGWPGNFIIKLEPSRGIPGGGGDEIGHWNLNKKVGRNQL